MMRKWWLLLLLGGTLAWGQAKPVTPREEPEPKSHLGEDEDDDDFEQPPEPESAHRVAMDAAVITIKGFCPGSATSSSGGRKVSCKTTITRAQFEKLATAIQPSMKTAVKQQLAAAYPQLLVMSHAAELQGLDKQPHYEQIMAYVQMQILTQALIRKVQDEAARVTARDIADYYEKNRDAFEEYTLQRLLVPLRKQASAGDTASTQEMTQLGEKLRKRAAAGEDLVKLQKEAFDAAGINVLSPNTSMGKIRRTSLPLAHADALKLQPGEVSQLITDASGHYIYKLEGKNHLRLDQVRGEIRYAIKNQRIKGAIDQIQNSYSAETNEAYFGTASVQSGGDRAASLRGQK